MKKIVLDERLGTKWFKFYTKVRPWLIGISALSSIVDFARYSEIYISHPILLLSLAATVASVVLGIMVALRSEEYEYGDFVKFVKGVLIFETVNIAFQQAIQTYINNGFESDFVLVYFVIALVIGYLLWYNLNAKYFEKRMLYIDVAEDGTKPKFYEIQKPNAADAENKSQEQTSQNADLDHFKSSSDELSDSGQDEGF